MPTYRIMKATTRAGRLRLVQAGAEFIENAPFHLQDAYEENVNKVLEGADAPTNLMANERWVAVATEAGQIVVICRYNKGERIIDLSELAKRPGASSDAMWALFKWAYFNEKPANGTLTLTAATRKLVEVYEGYGFTVEAAAQRRVSLVPAVNTTARVNAPMVFTEVKAELLSILTLIAPI